MAGKGDSVLTARKDDEVEPLSPCSPTIPGAIAKSSLAQAGTHIVHRVNLKKFDENGVADNRLLARRFSTPAGDELPSRGAGEPMRRINSLSMFGDGTPGDLEKMKELAKTRSLSTLEIVKRNKDAVEWFRQSKKVNRKVRSIEETEDMLSKARERRENGEEIVIRRKTIEKPADDDKPAESEAAAASDGKPVKKKMDAAALWGPKPIRKKSKEEAPPKRTSCMRGDVQVGASGENGLLARLRRRSTIA